MNYNGWLVIIITLLLLPSQNMLSSPADDGCVFISRVTSLSKLFCTLVRRTQSEREEVPLFPSTTLNWVEASCTVTPERIVAKNCTHWDIQCMEPLLIATLVMKGQKSKTPRSQQRPTQYPHSSLATIIGSMRNKIRKQKILYRIAMPTHHRHRECSVWWWLLLVSPHCSQWARLSLCPLQCCHCWGEGSHTLAHRLPWCYQ